MEACEDKFKSHGKRQNHLVNSHMFPPNYFFAVTKFGIDRRQSMLLEYREEQGSRHKGPRSPNQNPNDAEKSTIGPQSSKDAGAPKDVQMSESSTQEEEMHEQKQETTAIDTEMEDLVSAVSSLKFVPRTVRIGPKKAGMAGR